jgi:hypothetical protein
VWGAHAAKIVKAVLGKSAPAIFQKRQLEEKTYLLGCANIAQSSNELSIRRANDFLVENMRLTFHHDFTTNNHALRVTMSSGRWSPHCYVFHPCGSSALVGIKLGFTKIASDGCQHDLQYAKGRLRYTYKLEHLQF